ncbi:MAG: DUF2946 family protein [Pseudolabrys sp.]
MPTAIRKIVGILAIYAIALNTILAMALAPVPAGAAFDPLTVICHSVGDQTPDGQPAAPSKACDHCTLCGTAAAPANAIDDVLAFTLRPSDLIAVLRPGEAPRAVSVVATPNLARGPPLSA